jgi:malate dehydrogenase
LKSYQELLAGRTAGWSCAIGLTALTRAVLHDTGEVFPCSTVLDGEYGQSGLSMAVPVVLGGRGVQGIVEWELAPDEQAGVERTARALKPDAKVVDESL